MDCQSLIEKIIARCQQLNINCVAIADHGTAEGGLKMRKIAPTSLTIIVAEEVLTTSGEIMGMFLTETVSSGLSLRQSIELIKKQGGLVNVPHPFDTFPRTGLGLEALEEIAGDIDLIEAFNARSPYHQPSSQALAFAKKHCIPTSAGSDAHTLGEIGNAFVEMPPFSSRDDFLAALARGIIKGHKTSLTSRIENLLTKIKNHSIKKQTFPRESNV